MTLQTPSVTLDDTSRYGAVVSSPVPPPVAIAAERIFHAWHYEGDQKKPDPLPGGASTSVDKLAAGSYGEAYAHMTATGGDRLACALTLLSTGQSVAGVDLDNCRNKETGEIKRWAQEVITLFDSYTEVSPSGTGVKIFFILDAADLPVIEMAITQSRTGPGSRHARKWTWTTVKKHPPAIELFVSKRWFAYTGLHLIGAPNDWRRVQLRTILDLLNRLGPAFAAEDPGKATQPTQQNPAGPKTPHPAALNDNTAHIDTSRPATDLWQRIETTNSFELMRLLRGNVDHLSDKSRSGVAMALGGALKRDGYTRDEMKEALYDFAATSSWAAEQDDLDGRGFERIWANAAEPPPAPDPHVIGYVAPATKPPADHKKRTTRFQSRLDILNMPAPAWLYPGFVPKEGLIFSAGAPKSLKSFTAMLMAQCAVNVAPWAGVEPAFTEPLHVAYWAQEGRSGLNVRLSAIETEYQFAPSANLTLASGLLQIDDVIEQYGGKTLDIFFVDTLHKWVSALGLDENSSRDMGFAISELERLREALNCLVVVVHHTGLNGDKRMRGSSALLGAADGLLMSTSIAQGVAAFECVTLKEGEPGSPVVYRLKKVGDSAVAVVSEEFSPLPSGLTSAPRGEIEDLIMEIVTSLMPTGRPPVPPRGATAPLPADVMSVGIAGNGVLIATARDLFVMRRQGSNRSMKVQAFGRGVKSLQRKRLILVVGDYMRPMPVTLEGAL